MEALKHLSPIWYFHLKPNENRTFYFPLYGNLSPEEKQLIDLDFEYNNYTLEDAAYQAFKKGIIHLHISATNVPSEKDILVNDEYRFVAKYFHKGWSLYFLLCRLLSLNNPLKEIIGFFRSLSIKRQRLYSSTSSLSIGNQRLPDSCKVTVIIPTLNRYDHLKKILNDLSHQTIPAYEIIVIDQSTPKNEQFYSSFLHLPLFIIYQDIKGQWSARNEGLKISKGEYILFTDDDSKVKQDWVEQHLRCLTFFKADISAGISIPEGCLAAGDKTFFHWAEEFDSGNAMVKREIFLKTGLFDTSFDTHRMGDTEFGLRSYLEGFKSISNPLASRIHCKADKGGMRLWGTREAFKPMFFGGARPDPGVLYLFHRYFDRKYLASFLLVRIFLSYIPSQIKQTSGGFIIGAFLFILFSPWWGARLFINWKKIQKIRPSIEQYKFQS